MIHKTWFHVLFTLALAAITVGAAWVVWYLYTSIIAPTAIALSFLVAIFSGGL